MHVVWRYPAHQSIHAVAFSRDTSFAALAHSRLVAVASDTGAERWRARIPNTWGWIALCDGTVVYLAQHNKLAAFDAHDGGLCWSRNLRGISGWLHASGSYIVVGGWRGYTDITCLSVSTGETLWTYPARGKMLHSTSILRSGLYLLIADTDDCCVHLVELASGREAEVVKVEGEWLSDRPDGIPGASSACWCGLPKALYLSGGTRALMRITVAPLRTELLALPENSASIGPAGPDGWFAFVADSCNLWSTHRGGEAWSNHGPIAHYNQRTLAIVKKKDGMIIAGTSEGLLYKFHSIDGSLVSRVRVGKRIRQQLGLSGGQVCLATESGELLGVEA